MKILAIIVLLGGLTGCSTTNLADVMQQAAKDDATVVVNVSTIYGTGRFIRTNPRTNQTATVSPDGTVTIGIK